MGDIDLTFVLTICFSIKKNCMTKKCRPSDFTSSVKQDFISSGVNRRRGEKNQKQIDKRH